MPYGSLAFVREAWRRLPALLGWLWVCLALLPASALAQASDPTERPRIYVGVYLHDVSAFDQKDGVFDVDAELWAKWRGDLEPAEIRIANAARIDRRLLGHDVDGTWHSARWRVRGTLRGEFPLHRFPFDTQTLPIVLELPEAFGTLVPDLAGSGMNRTFSVTDWLYHPEFRPVVSARTFRSDLGNLAMEGLPTTMHRVSFEVRLQRPVLPVVLKLFLPLFIVAMVVMASLYVDPATLQPRVTMSVTGLVACFAFQFSVSDVLPEVAYLTLADTLFIVVYLISTTCVATAVLSNVLHHRGRLREVMWFERTVRVGLPVAALALVWTALPSELPPPPPMADPIPEMRRTPSASDTLRIGTTGSMRVASSPAGFAAYWPMIYDDPQDGPQPVLVEQAPRVDNDAMRFLAGGEIEVRWQIREGARWSDGHPVTAADLLLPLEASPDPRVVEARTPDERTVILRWDDRLARALQAPTLWPAHVVGQVYQNEGFDGVRQALGNGGVPSVGPYHIVSHDEERVVAVANPHFLGAPPNIARVELVRYPSSRALAEAFRAGEVQVVVPNSVREEDIDPLEAERPEVAHHLPTASFVFLQPDLEHPLLGRREVRQAILAALDREGLAAAVYGEGSEVAHIPLGGPLPEGVVQTPYAPQSAREALQASGALGAELPLLHAASAPAELVARIAADLRAAGLRVTPQEVDSSWRTWRERGHGGLLLHILRGDRDAPPRQWWNLPQVNGRYATDARHDAYDDALHDQVERQDHALYPERRAQLQDALMARFSRRLPYLPLVFATEHLLVDPALRGWQRAPDDPFGLGLETWWIASER